MTAATLALLDLSAEQQTQHEESVTTFVNPPFSGLIEFLDEHAAFFTTHPLRLRLSASHCAKAVVTVLSSI